ncbi:IucA/IucC family protein [Nonomuraea indica]|uniref:IucA/IucC family protein n=1 Tax=Nonomuraea indica TaxID=1581193 RepID=UPI001FEB3010|nr:IucA/IucC family protein [Nonomuraea indica]
MSHVPPPPGGARSGFPDEAETGFAAEFAAELAAVRPGLTAPCAAALPGARAAVLARLWRGLLYEPLPGVADRGPGSVRLGDGRLLTGPARLPHDLDPAVPTSTLPTSTLPTGSLPTDFLPTRGHRTGGHPTGGNPTGGHLLGDEPGGGHPGSGHLGGRHPGGGHPGGGHPGGGQGGGMVVWLDGRAYTDPAELLAALGLPGTARLVGDLERSTASLALSRADAAALDPARGPGRDLAFEQDVVDGHPYHPCCRNRPGFSVAEQLAYAPEHRPVVRLDLVAVPAARCLLAGPWPARLTDGDRILVPVHPWQSRHRLPELGLEPSGRSIPARPLMSLRTLAPLDGGPHVKTAVSARMTSHVRDISAASVRDAVPLSDLLTRAAARLGSAGPYVARYLCGAAALVDGRPSAEVAVLLREPPSRFAGSGEVVAPLAALTARPADGGPPLIHVLAGGRPAREAHTREAHTRGAAARGGGGAGWMAAFARAAFGAGLGLLAMGIALEAHGQNLLVVLDRHGRPVRLVYRDLADIRVSPARLARHGLETPPLHARLLTDDPWRLREKLFGSLVGTTFGTLVSALGQGDRDVEARLWDEVAAAARRAFDELPATGRADRAALFGAELPVKAHTLMQLEGGPPGDRWAYLPNPLAGA